MTKEATAPRPLLTTTNQELNKLDAKQVRKFLKAHDQWTALCANLKAEQAAGRRNGPAAAAWGKGRPVAKSTKAFAFSAGTAMALRLGQPRPNTVEDLRALVA